MRACGFTPHPVNFESSSEPRASFQPPPFSSSSSSSVCLSLSLSLVLSAVARLIEREANYNHNLTVERRESRENERMVDEVKHADDGRMLNNLDQTWRRSDNCQHLATRDPPKQHGFPRFHVSNYRPILHNYRRIRQS